MAQWDESFDFVVAGSGGGGFCAALAARELGKSVVVLESTDKVGGSTAMSGGILWIPNHPLQAKAGVSDSREAGLAYLKALNTDDVSPMRFRRDEAFLDTGPQVVDFLLRKGIPLRRCDGWSDYHDELPGGCARGRSVRTELFDLKRLGSWLPKFRRSSFPIPLHWPDTQQLALMKRTMRGRYYAAKVGLRVARMRLLSQLLVSGGGALQARMLTAVLAAGADVRTEAPVIDLVRDDSGRVEGVVVQAGGAARRIEARHGVLIAAGGFARNQALRDQHGPKPAHADWSHANPGDDGSMLSIAMRHGADTALMDNAIWIVTSRQPGGALAFHLYDLAKPHGIMVNRQGQRVTDEAGSYLQNGRNMYKNGGVPAWVIFDSRHRERYIWGGALPGRTPPEWLKSGYLKKADTLDGIAQACGVDPTGLAETVARVNRFAASGVDEDFGRGGRAYDRIWGDPHVRPNPVLGALEKPPFYAVEVVPGDVGTAGGLVIDEHARVVARDGTPIEGLYAAGNSTASIFGRTYPGAGASIGATFAFGYIAAKHALTEAGRRPDRRATAEAERLDAL